jgi:hypothetical protein
MLDGNVNISSSPSKLPVLGDLGYKSTLPEKIEYHQRSKAGR